MDTLAISLNILSKDSFYSLMQQLVWSVDS